MSVIYAKTVPGPKTDKSKSLVTTLIEKLLKYPSDQIAARDVINKEEITYHQILKDTLKVAKYLKTMGITKGDVIAFMSENSFVFHSYMLGALLCGAIFAPLSSTFTFYELDQICSWLKPKIVIFSEATIDIVLDVQEKYNFQASFSSKPMSNDSQNDSIDIFEFDAFLTNEHQQNDPVVLLCSSGTTGLPKGVLHTNFSMLSTLDYLGSTQFGAEKTDVILAYLPFNHMMGLITIFGNLYSGQKMILLQKFKSQIFLSAIEKFQVNKMQIVPTVGIFLAHSDTTKYDLSSFKEMICAGSMLSTSTYNAIKRKLPKVDIRLAYGMSEMGYSTMTPPSCEFTGSVGQLMAGCMAKVIDPETAEIQSVYKTGELCIFAPSNFLGYYRNETDTLGTIDPDGFIHTGDVAYLDDCGNIFIVDRIKELIKHKSFQVSPAELEAILLKHEAVADVGVIGVPDERCGELPRAFVVIQHKSCYNKANRAVLEQELRDFVARHVSPYKHLSGGVEFVDEVPKNPSGKILRRLLKAKYLG